MTTLILDCSARKKSGFSSSGIYSIDPDGKGLMNVSCDMVTDGGGWTVIQRRVDGTTDFYLNWTDYKRGFGSLTGNFWLGNDDIHRLTASGNSMLRVELEDWEGNTVYAVYGTFLVDDESNKYRLTAENYVRSSTVGNSLYFQGNMFFSTKDRDNLPQNSFNPAQKYTGAWWYTSSSYVNLNGQYLGDKISDNGIIWISWKYYPLSLKRSEMKIRPPLFI